jgi:hypothetical protein
MGETGPYYKGAYSKLNASNHEIRLLILPHAYHIQPPNLICKMITVSLKDNPSYRTVSYSWRTETHMASRIIDINDHFQLITANLEHLLRRLSARHADPSESLRTFWVDQVCINQEDTSERSQQVGLMGQIYGRAQGLVVWLGEDISNQCLLATSIMKSLASDSSDGEEGDPSHTSLLKALGRRETGFPKTAFDAVSALFRTPWWKRAWVVQELALSKHDIEVIWGTAVLPWFTIMKAVERIHCESLNPTLDNAALQTIEWNHAVALQRVHRHDDNSHLYYPKSTLLELCCMFASRKASDPHDKIFAFMGLAADYNEAEFAPDYSLPVHQLYQNFARHVISRTESLEILRVASCGHASHLPTWVPDWDQKPSGWNGHHQRMGSALRVLFDTRAKRFESTIGSSAKNCFSDGMGVLRTQGYCVHKVLDITKPLHDRHAAVAFTRRQIVAILENWENFAQRHVSDIYPTGEPFDEAFWRTLMGNSDVEGQDIDSIEYDGHFEQGFEVFMEREAKLSRLLNQKEEAEREDLISQISHPFYLSMMAATYDQVFFISSQGYIGLAPSGTRVGDHLCLLLGASVPFILRRAGDRFSLVGSVYCHGFMKGEVFKRLQQEQKQPEWLCLE